MMKLFKKFFNKTPLIFSVSRDQKIFMTLIMAIMSFLAVLALGITLSIGNGVSKWAREWNLYATVQIMPDGDIQSVEKIIAENRKRFKSVELVSNEEMKKLLGPWISGGASALSNYLPKMYEIKFENKNDIKLIGAKLSPFAKFITHSESLKPSTSAGWKLIGISTMILLLVLGAIVFCISYISINIARLHRRELEILTMVGAYDKFVANQMQIIVAKICVMATTVGFVSAMLCLMLVISAAQSARVGLMSVIGLNTFGVILLILLPIAISIASIYITKKTTLRILGG